MNKTSADDPPVHERVPFLELKHGDKRCRWPIGTVGEATFGFCGRPQHTGPYCEDHAKRAYVPAQKAHKLWHGV